jgi:hypothetical protein
MRKIITFPLGFFLGITIFFGTNTFTEKAKADFTDPDAFTFTDPASNSSEGCPSCSEVSLNLSLPTTPEPPPPPPPPQPPSDKNGGGGGGSSGGGGGGGGGGAGLIIKKDLPIANPVAASSTTDLVASPIQANATTSKTAEEISEEKKVDSSSLTSLFGLDKKLAETISSSESKKITGREIKVQFSGNNLNIYKKIIANKPTLSEKTKITVAYFIEFGTPTTQKLGAGERAGVINSYLAAFGRIPSTDDHWQDVIKIANGRWPAEKSSTAESKASVKFKKIYLKNANMKNANDNAAVTVMSYGLRPVNRNMNSEKSAILSFKHIYKKAPTTAEDWDIVRAIAYSGAKR